MRESNSYFPDVFTVGAKRLVASALKFVEFESSVTALIQYMKGLFFVLKIFPASVGRRQKINLKLQLRPYF